jgi:hypothetical protein
MPLTAAEHVELVQSLFTLDEFVIEELQKLSNGKREDFAKRILQLMTTTDLAKSKGLTDIVTLKKALDPTKKDKDVKVSLWNVAKFKIEQQIIHSS